MGKLFTPANTNSGFNTDSSISANFTAIETALDNCLSLNGDAPNAMNADIDMNSNNVTNVATLYAADIMIDGAAIPSLSDVQTYATNASNSATAAATSASEAAASAASINIPTISAGDADKLLQVNAGETGYQFVTFSSLLPTADTTTAGVLEVATTAEAQAGALDTKIMTPAKVQDWYDNMGASTANYVEVSREYRYNNAGNIADSTSFDLTTIGTGALVGSTASGATYTWTAMDALPSSTKGIYVTIRASGNWGGNSSPSLIIYGGGTSSQNIVFEFSPINSTYTMYQTASNIFIPTYSGGVQVVMGYSITDVTGPGADMYLEGYVV